MAVVADSSGFAFDAMVVTRRRKQGGDDGLRWPGGCGYTEDWKDRFIGVNLMLQYVVAVPLSISLLWRRGCAVVPRREPSVVIYI